MKITVWGINYDPEPTWIGPFNTDLCAFLAERGHEVTMLSSFPYYPWWKKRPSDRGKLYETTSRGPVKVCRCWHYVPAKPSTLKRLVHELSFVTTSALRALFLPSPDLFIVISPPLFLGIGAFAVSRLLRRNFIFHVQDLQPDAALGLGMIKPGLAVRVLYFLEKQTYRAAAMVSGISQGMMTAFSKKGVSSQKAYLLPNWIPDAGKVPSANAVSFRAQHGITESTPLIAYSGNIGAKQGIEVVVEAAVLLKAERKGDDNSSEPIHWAICGDGAAKPTLEAMIKTSLATGVSLYPLQPDDLYHALLRETDVNLITQQRGTGQFFFPSKLLSILQYGRPVLAVADESSELSRAVREGQFGLVVPSGDAPALLAAARKIVEATAEQKAEWASRGHAWVDQFRRNRVLSAFEDRLKQIS